MNIQSSVAKASRFIITPTHPALSVGLIVFTFLGVVVNLVTGNALTNHFALKPSLLRNFQLNNLSFYSMLHTGVFHWLLNMLALFAPLLHFERHHGTVYTGVTLNLLTVIAALQYCIVGTLLFPNTPAVGVSGIVFSLMTFTAVKENGSVPVLRLGRLGSRDVQVPTLYMPFIMLCLCFFLFPSSLFWGHLLGISTGYLLAKGYLTVLYPPSWIVIAIESRLAPLISLLSPLVVFHGEEDAVVRRQSAYVSLLPEPDMEQGQPVIPGQPLPPVFPGQGRVVGES